MKQNLTNGITVAVRIRPFSEREMEAANNYCTVRVLDTGGKSSSIQCSKHGGKTQVFAMEHVFSAETSQQETYTQLALPLLHQALDGYNACLFAYGVTSSGKTHSIYGTPESPGIVPRLVEDLFAKINDRYRPNCPTTVHLNYFEIYNERIIDLLKNGNCSSKPLVVHEHPTTGPFVDGLLQPAVHTSEEVFAWLRRGDSRRSVAPTRMNSKSSRSHTIVTFIITRQELAKFTMQKTIENVFTSKLNLVDLAGSERQSTTQNSSLRLIESCQINKSLFTLGKVISQLSEGGGGINGCSSGNVFNPLTERRRLHDPHKQHLTPIFRTPQPGTRKRKAPPIYVSYRDSLLTWLLKESLGGNSVTAMLATVSPSSLHFEDTLATLQYAQRAQSIVNTAVVNEDPNGQIIRELKLEIERLQMHVNQATKDPRPSLSTQIQDLQQRLDAREDEVSFLTSELTKRTVDYERLQSEYGNASLTRFTNKTKRSLETDGCLHRIPTFKESEESTPFFRSKRFKSDLRSEPIEGFRLEPDGSESTHHKSDHELKKVSASVPEEASAEVQKKTIHSQTTVLVYSSASTMTNILASPQEKTTFSEIYTKNDTATNTNESIASKDEFDMMKWQLQSIASQTTSLVYSSASTMTNILASPQEKTTCSEICTKNDTATNTNESIVSKEEFDAMKQKLERLEGAVRNAKHYEQELCAKENQLGFVSVNELEFKLLKQRLILAQHEVNTQLNKEEETSHKIDTLQKRLESNQWDVDYLEKVNVKLTTERDKLAQMLTRILRERKEPLRTTTQPSHNSSVLVTQISDNWRAEMESILSAIQFGAEVEGSLKK